MKTAREAASGGDPEALRLFFTLGPDDLALLGETRRDSHRLALGLALVWARAERTLIGDPAALPGPLVAHVAAQMGLSAEVLADHKGWPATRAGDAAAVRAHLGVRSFEAGDAEQLEEFLKTKVAHTGNSAALIDAAEEWLARHDVLRPGGATTIERLVYAARAAAEEEILPSIAAQMDDAERDALDRICRTEEGDSVLAMLNAPPRQASADSIKAQCQRLGVIRAATPRRIEWGPVTPNRLRQWAAIVRRLDARALRRYPPAKRYTLLVAFLRVRGEETTDAIVEMLDTLVGRAFTRSDRALKDSRATQAQLNAESVRTFRMLAKVLLDASVPPERVREEVFALVPRERVSALIEQGSPFEGSEAEAFFRCLDLRYPHLREFTPVVLDTLRFASSRADNALLAAVEALRALNAGGLRKVPGDAPVAFVPKRWEAAVVGATGADRHGWELSLLAELRNALRAGELTVGGSRRYAPWDGDLYSKGSWGRRRGTWFGEGGLPESGQAYVDLATTELHDLTAGVAQRLPANADARIDKGKLVVTALQKLEVPPEATQARVQLVGLLPWVSLPELLMEVDGWEGCEFTRALLHLAGRRQPSAAHVTAVRPALFAVLVAEATNVGLAAMAHACGIPEGQLRRVYDWYFHEDALRQAITMVIAHHGALPLTSRLGSGHTSSSDGVRFGVASSALNARHLPRWFGMRRGLTLYSHVLDQGTQYWVDMVSCQLREATFVLDGLLYQDAPAITEHYTDTHGATELVFGLFALLGFRFSPRLADLPDQVLYRGTRGADYGALNPVVRQSVRTSLIVSEWDDLNRLAASLKDGLARPSLIVTRLQGMRRQNPLQQAIAELGRIDKTRHILSIADDPEARRRMLVGLNKQERLHAMAREVSFGRQGRYGDRGYEAQLARASCLSLVLNAMVVWTTRYLWAAAEELARRGQAVPEEAWRYLSALMWEHIGLIGDFSFEDRPPLEGLRPLRAQGS